MIEMAVGEGALTCTLSLLEQKAASRVRVEARDEILRDLLEGSAGYRQEALARAKRIHIDLSRPQRGLHGALDGFEDGANAEGWDSARVERAQRELAGMAQRVLAAHDAGDLLAVRGEAMLALVPFAEREAVDRLLLSLNEELRR